VILARIHQSCQGVANVDLSLTFSFVAHWGISPKLRFNLIDLGYDMTLSSLRPGFLSYSSLPVAGAMGALLTF
jgi:hypothetical protein